MLPAYAGMILSVVPFPAYEDVLPAYAGMIPPSSAHPANWPRAPRVCGDDPASASAATTPSKCSPRMRG